MKLPGMKNEDVFPKCSRGILAVCIALPKHGRKELRKDVLKFGVAYEISTFNELYWEIGRNAAWRCIQTKIVHMHELFDVTFV